MKEFRGGYYSAILELLVNIDKKEYHGKELFELFENKFGSGNIINFRKTLKKLVESKKLSRSNPREYNRRYYKLIIKPKKNTIVEDMHTL